MACSDPSRASLSGHFDLAMKRLLVVEGGLSVASTLVIENVRHSWSGYTKAICNLALNHICFSSETPDLCNRATGDNCEVAVFAMLVVKPFLASMLIVGLIGNPLKITDAVIQFVAIDVMGAFGICRLLKKGLCNEPVHVSFLAAKVHESIPIARNTTREDLPSEGAGASIGTVDLPVQATDSPLVADLVKAFVVFDWLPNFHKSLKKKPSSANIGGWKLPADRLHVSVPTRAFAK